MNRIIKLISIVLFMSAMLPCQQIAKCTNSLFPENISEQMQTSQVVQDLIFNGSTMSSTGRPLISIQQVWSIDNNRWENYRKKETEYPVGKVSSDALSIVILMWNFFWSLEQWILESQTEVHTDEEGNIAKEVTSNSQGTALQEIYYNAPYTNGQPATTLSLLYNGSGWENSWQQSHNYNSDGDEIERTGENWEENSWVQNSRSVKTYTQPSCLAGWTNFFINENGEWIPYKRATYVYDETDYMDKMIPYYPCPLKRCNPNKVITETSCDNGVSWTTTDFDYYTDFGVDTYLPYMMIQNPSNNEAKVDMTYIDSEGNSMFPQKVSSIYDNSNLRCTKTITQEYLNDAWVNKEKYLHSYEGYILATESAIMVPDEFALAQNYPNPFNPNTTISFSLAEESIVNLSVYDLSGKLIKEIANSKMTIGNYSIEWDSKDANGAKVGAGVYIYKLQTDKFSESRKMILLK